MPKASNTRRSTDNYRCNLFFLVIICNGAFHIVNGTGYTDNISHDQLIRDDTYISSRFVSVTEK